MEQVHRDEDHWRRGEHGDEAHDEREEVQRLGHVVEVARVGCAVELLLPGLRRVAAPTAAAATATAAPVVFDRSVEVVPGEVAEAPAAQRAEPRQGVGGAEDTLEEEPGQEDAALARPRLQLQTNKMHTINTTKESRPLREQSSDEFHF